MSKVNLKPERRVQTDIIQWIKANGGYVVKVMVANVNGCPDLLACIDGRFVAIECKAEKFTKDPMSQASPWQKKHLEMCVASLEQFKEVMDEMCYL